MVHEALKEEFKEVHSIAINALNPEEFKEGSKFVTPGCSK